MKTHSKIFFSIILLVAGFACQPQNQQNSEQKIVDKSHLQRDLLQAGSFTVDESLYSVASAIDYDVLPAPPAGKPEVKTDIRGKLYLPKGTGKFPVLVYLHGNHATCGEETGEGNPRIDTTVDYTLKGSCPDGLVESPSFLGYEYSARQLASWGYAVISINANLGITGRNGYDAWDNGLVYARGALVLKHLITLRKWSLAGDSSALANRSLDVNNKFDFTEVGLMGHSRGGEGVRYAYNIYEKAAVDSVWKQQLPDLKIKGVFEIAPVDFGTTSGALKAEALGTAWAVLIGGCDRDVSTFMGTGPYARMLSSNDGHPKAIFTVWGANHNFFNTEWQESDAPNACIGSQKPLWNVAAQPFSGALALKAPNALQGVKGSEVQQAFAKGLMFSFFKATVGKQTDSTLLHTFDTQYALPIAFNELGPTNREFIRLKDSVLVAKAGSAVSARRLEGTIALEKLNDKLKELQAYWNAVATQDGYTRLTVALLSGIFPRDPLILVSPVLTAEQTVDVPFQSLIDTSNYWTVDASLARRTGCFTYPEKDCVPEPGASEVDVALVYEDGTNSKFVQLSDYIKLENYYSNYFERVFVRANPQEEKSFTLGFNYVPLLFSTARFELTDFSLQNQNIKGLRFKFPAGKRVELAVDEVRLVKR
ncbi:MAG TPA: hypothetical protein VE954_21790 [Oligoflexus sp.]|uniref:hypothetical protein n=1 Tax=Oligoflexus sp. TaxID=1971216 RepID=UPI002D622762|nr:hypothetical protein [Oligoflexus sp.]HYX35738.1 hypothetical protein [Oligoflexus sp.]